MAHFCFALLLGIWKFGQQKAVIFVVLYFLVLELITEKFIFTKRNRKKIHQEGKEVILMLKEEISKRKINW